MLRPSLRIKPVAAVAVVVGAYLVRSVVIRSGDFSPDLPGDAIAASVLGIALLVATVVRAHSTDEHDNRLDTQHRDKDEAARGDGQREGL